MQILNISFKNFTSYGNNLQTISFANNGAGDLYLLLGKSGEGKSSISEIIIFSLFGRVDKKTKQDLPNRINKALWTKIELFSKGKKIDITRGISPNLFEVNIDGQSVDTAGNSNIQDYLENEIYDIPYQVFKNIVVLSINDFKSFLTMSPHDKRNIIDKLFGFSIINEMKDTVKKERTLIKDDLKTITNELIILNNSIESITNKIKKIEEIKAEDNSALVLEYNIKINKLLEIKVKCEEDIIKISSLEQKISALLEDRKSSFVTAKHEVKALQNQVSLYENDKCPLCYSPLHTTEHEHRKVELMQKIASTAQTIKDLNEQITETTQKQRDLGKKIKELNLKYTQSSVMALNYKKDVNKLTEEQKDINKDSLVELSNEQFTEISARKIKQQTKLTEDQFLDVIESIFSDNGVKSLAMKSILPSLNLNISSMLTEIHLPYLVKFNENFDCVITSMGEEINSRTMSTGEKKKADFITIIALLKILKMRYPTLNLLFLDEIFSSIDPAGVYDIIKILNKVAKEHNLNTVVINHSELPTELFDKKIEVSKIGGFSQLTQETLN